MLDAIPNHSEIDGDRMDVCGLRSPEARRLRTLIERIIDFDHGPKTSRMMSEAGYPR